MAYKSSFFNSVNGDRRYKAEAFAEYFASFVGNGVFPNPSTGCQIMENTPADMHVILKPGKAWINGYFFVNETDYKLKLDNADGVNKRIDTIVLQLNFLNREIVPVIRKGAYVASNATATAPAPTKDADIIEIVLAHVAVGQGVTSITQANITDTRLNKTICGVVQGTVDQVDTTTIFNQYLDWFNNFKQTQAADLEAWMNTEKTDFEQWLAELQAALDGNTAANLANQISVVRNDLEDHKNAVMPHIYTNAKDGKRYRYGFKSNDTNDGLIFIYEEVQING